MLPQPESREIDREARLRAKPQLVPTRNDQGYPTSVEGVAAGRPGGALTMRPRARPAVRAGRNNFV